MSEHVDAVIAFYENLSRERLDDLRELYAPDAHFKDPFNDVVGHEEIVHIFEHMFFQVDAPAFRVVNRICDDRQALLEWVFTFALGRRSFVVQGASVLYFGQDGRIERHRDYWDTGEELYEKLPAIGMLMRMLRRRMSAKRRPTH